MRIQPALTNAKRFTFTGAGGELFVDKTVDQEKRTEVAAFIQSSFTGESLAFQLSLADVIGLQGFFNRFDNDFDTGPDDYIEIVSGRRHVFSISARREAERGVTVVMTDMDREIGKRMIAMIELGERATQSLREMVRGLPTHAWRFAAG